MVDLEKSRSRSLDLEYMLKMCTNLANAIAVICGNYSHDLLKPLLDVIDSNWDSSSNKQHIS